MADSTQKQLLLGTAQWGWTVSKSEAFQLLDSWLAAGNKGIDAATNYPINKLPEQFRAAEKILLEYIQAHGLQDLQVTMKVGSVNNMRTPEINLSPSFLHMIATEYQRVFTSNLQTVMLHWDNRSDEQEIRQTAEALLQIRQNLGLQPGLSGIKHPEIYAPSLKDLGLVADIQVKHNVLQSDISRYTPIYSGASGDEHRFFAYGINAGGRKLQGPMQWPLFAFLVRRPCAMTHANNIVSGSH